MVIAPLRASTVEFSGIACPGPSVLQLMPGEVQTCTLPLVDPDTTVFPATGVGVGVGLAVGTTVPTAVGTAVAVGVAVAVAVAVGVGVACSTAATVNARLAGVGSEFPEAS